MAYKFQLGKMSTQSNGSIKMIDGNFTVADGGSGEITAVNVEAKEVSGAGGTVSVGDKLTVSHPDSGLIVSNASAGTDRITIASSMNSGHELVSVFADSNARAQLIVRRRDGGDGASNEMILTGPSDGSGANLGAANHGFLQMKTSAGATPIKFEGETGDAELSSITLAGTTASSVLRIDGNLVSTGNLNQTGNVSLVEVDSTVKRVAGQMLTVNDSYDGSTFNNNTSKGGFSIHGTAQMILKKQDRSIPGGGTDSAIKAIEFLNNAGNAALTLEADKFFGDGSKLLNVDANGNKYSPTLNLITNASDNLVAGQLNVVHSNPGGACTLTLPAANTLAVGTAIKVINLRHDASATNKLTIQRTGSDTIDGATSFDVSSGEAVISMVVVDDSGTGKYMIM